MDGNAAGFSSFCEPIGGRNCFSSFARIDVYRKWFHNIPPVPETSCLFFSRCPMGHTGLTLTLTVTVTVTLTVTLTFNIGTSVLALRIYLPNARCISFPWAPTTNWGHKNLQLQTFGQFRNCCEKFGPMGRFASDLPTFLFHVRAAATFFYRCLQVGPPKCSLDASLLLLHPLPIQSGPPTPLNRPASRPRGRSFFFPSLLFPQPSLVQTVLLVSLQAHEEHEARRAKARGPCRSLPRGELTGRRWVWRGFGEDLAPVGMIGFNVVRICRKPWGPNRCSGERLWTYDCQ